MNSISTTLEELVALCSTKIGSTSIIVSILLVLYTYHYYANVYTFFKRRGIKGPTPLPFVGNLHSLLTSDRMVLERTWSEKYGKFYGIFNGSSPRYIVNDPEVLLQVCIKDFASMPNHDSSELNNHYQKEFIFFSQDDQWRRLRKLQSPTFTSGKIKRMFKLLDVCADDLVQNFAEQLDDGHKSLERATVNVKEIYSLYTMDGITSAAYTIKLDRKINKSGRKGAATRGDFVNLAMRLFEFKIWKIFIAFTIPRSFLKAIGWSVLPRHYFTELDAVLSPIVKQRQNSGKKYDDYLQILVDARIDDKMELDEIDEKENHHAALTHDGLKADQENLANDIAVTRSALSSKAKLTDHEIISSAIFLLIVGLETTATLLSNCSYALAFHKDIQERLRETLKQIAEKDPKTGEYSFDYEKLTSCEYLDAVISETLRTLSPVIALDRVVNQDYYIEKYGVHLRKGDKLNLAYYAIMNNPEYWPDPLKFDPERFMGENKKRIVPGSYCPFGLGPRHCLGMRFSLTEAKLALAKVLMKFQFSPAPETRFPPECRRALGLNNLKRPLVQITVK